MSTGPKQAESALIGAFEDELHAYAGGQRDDDPSLEAARVMLFLLVLENDENDANRSAARKKLRGLEEIFQRARLDDDNWRFTGAVGAGVRGIRPKRTFALQPHHTPGDLSRLAPLAQLLWPLLPLLSFLRFHRGKTSWSGSEKYARFWHAVFVLAATNPATDSMRAVVSGLAEVVVVRYVRGRRLCVDQGALAERLAQNWLRRKSPVRRFNPKARTIQEAVTLTRNYVLQALERRLNDVLGDEGQVAASTRRRWRKEGLRPTSPTQVHDTREEKRARQRHTVAERYSLAFVARTLGVSRSTVRKALTVLESEGRMVAERSALPVAHRSAHRSTILLTRDQVKTLHDALSPAAKRRTAGAR